MNHERIYEYRFKDIDQAKREQIWKVLSQWFYDFMGKPHTIIEPACGRCEFLNQVPAQERWGIDRSSDVMVYGRNLSKSVQADIFDADLPLNFFDAVFISNFLEHLPSQDKVEAFFQKVYSILKPGGRICIMGPNFKYAYREYFDCADHILPLSHIAVEELLYSVGYETKKIYPKFLPFSFRSRLPAHPLLTRAYLAMPFAWQFLGKQFLILATKPKA